MTNRFALIRVLVVDNDETQLAQMVAYLQKLGVVHYVTAGDGEEALKLLLDSEHNFHIVFTDKDMPKMDGLDLFIAVTKHPQLQHIRMAMISGDFSRQGNSSVKEIGTRDFLQISGVVTIPKDGLDASVLGRTIQELTGV